MQVRCFTNFFCRLSPGSCVCSNSLGVSVDPSLLTIQKTRRTIVISQTSAGSLTKQDFEYVLRLIRFAHDPMRPNVDQYSAYVSVSVDDGEFRSEPAFTRIDVFITNMPPSILVNGQTNASAVMSDGEPVISLLPAGSMVTLFEDSTTVEEVSITLTNPGHSSEEIRISVDNIPNSINVTADGTTIVLRGPASPVDFDQLLTESTIYYDYPPMASILQGDRPEFTTR